MKRAGAVSGTAVSNVALAVEDSITIDFGGLADGTAASLFIPVLMFSNATAVTAGVSLNEFEFPPHSGTNGRIICFSTEILLLIEKRIPEVTLTLVGPKTEPEGARAVGREPGAASNRCGRGYPALRSRSRRVYRSPHSGGGTRIKVFEAMAMGKPVISTTSLSWDCPSSTEKICCTPRRRKASPIRPVETQYGWSDASNVLEDAPVAGHENEARTKKWA